MCARRGGRRWTKIPVGLREDGRGPLAASIAFDCVCNWTRPSFRGRSTPIGFCCAGLVVVWILGGWLYGSWTEKGREDGGGLTSRRIEQCVLRGYGIPFLQNMQFVTAMPKQARYHADDYCLHSAPYMTAPQCCRYSTCTHNAVHSTYCEC